MSIINLELTNIYSSESLINTYQTNELLMNFIDLKLQNITVISNYIFYFITPGKLTIINCTFYNINKLGLNQMIISSFNKIIISNLIVS